MLHTRISEQLAEDIRVFAEDLRVPASNLVRNVLEEVFTVVNSVSGDVGDLMDDLVEEAEGVRERVRRQARSRRPSAHPRSSHRRSRRGRRDEADLGDVEEELRRDEAREAENAFAGGTSGAEESLDPGQGDRAAGAQSDLASPAELFPDILGWQPLVVNRDFECGRCGCALHSGESAFLGLAKSGLTDAALCGPCTSGRTTRSR